MAASEENGALFPIFILTIMALPLVPYTILKLCRAASKKTKVIHCQCAECSRSGKYRKSIFKRVSSSVATSIHYSKFNYEEFQLFVGIMVHPHIWNLLVLFLQISNFSTCSNMTLVLLWVIMTFLVYYIKSISQEVNAISRVWVICKILWLLSCC